MWDYKVIVDKLAKQAMKHMNNEVQIPLSKAEIKEFVLFVVFPVDAYSPVGCSKTPYVVLSSAYKRHQKKS